MTLLTWLNSSSRTYGTKFCATWTKVRGSEVVGLLAYKEDVAGGRMSPRFSRLRPESTVDEAIAYLRRQATQVETIYYAYAVDDEQHLLGVVSLGDLFVAERTKRVKDVVNLVIFVNQTNVSADRYVALVPRGRVVAGAKGREAQDAPSGEDRDQALRPHEDETPRHQTDGLGFLVRQADGHGAGVTIPGHLPVVVVEPVAPLSALVVAVSPTILIASGLGAILILALAVLSSNAPVERKKRSGSDGCPPTCLHELCPGCRGAAPRVCFGEELQHFSSLVLLQRASHWFNLPSLV
jgi:hypothetical protein